MPTWAHAAPFGWRAAAFVRLESDAPEPYRGESKPPCRRWNSGCFVESMVRALWTGSLSFGLVSMWIDHPHRHQGQPPRFRMLRNNDKSPIPS
jgi:hypothetical protein